MALKAVLSEQEFGELGEDVKGLYTQTEDGGYVVDVEGVDDLPTVQGLKSGHQRSKKERDEAKRAYDALKKKFGPLADLEDIDLSDADQERLEKVLPFLKGEVDSLEGDDPDDGKGNKKDTKNQPDIEKIKQNARKPIERERDEAVAERDALKAQLHANVTDSALTSAVSEIKVAGPFVKAVKAMFKDKVKVVDGEDGPVAMIEGEYGEQPVSAYLKEWAQTDEGKEFVAARMNGGGHEGRSSGSSGQIKNPFKKVTAEGKPNPAFSMSEQGRLVKDQPDVARRMAKEAGWSDKHITW